MIARFLPLTLIIGAVTAPAQAEAITALSATAIDGQTLDLDGRRVRLFGVDAPALDQMCQRGGGSWACGVEAQGALDQMVRGQSVDCIDAAKMADGLTVAQCQVQGQSLSLAMVQMGMAVAAKDADAALLSVSEAIRAQRLGLWESDFTPPADYRALSVAKPAPKSSRSASNGQPPLWQGGCVIKGNINRKGEWIYHIPGMPYYGATRAEAIFCTEAEAQRAGYRRAIVRRY